jgi:hypothetical protein
MKGSLAGISRCDGDRLTRRESEPPRLCGIKSSMVLHISRLDQSQGLITCQLLHGSDIRSLSGLEVLPQAGNPLLSQSGSQGRSLGEAGNIPRRYKGRSWDRIDPSDS